MSTPNPTNRASLFGWGFAGLVFVAIAASGDLTSVQKLTVMAVAGSGLALVAYWKTRSSFYLLLAIGLVLGGTALLNIADFPKETRSRPSLTDQVWTDLNARYSACSRDTECGEWLAATELGTATPEDDLRCDRGNECGSFKAWYETNN